MIDFIQLFDDYSVDYKLDGKNVSKDFIGVNCPHCGDTAYHGGVPKNGSPKYTCWRCGTHSLNKTLSILMGVKNVEGILKEYSDGIPLVASTENKKTIIRPDTVIVPGEDIQWYHRDYLSKRRYDPDYLIQKYHIKGTGPMSEFGARVYFPIIFKNEVVSYQGRSIAKNPWLKYMTAAPDKEKIHHKHILFNYDNAQDDFVVLVEGVFDAVRLGDGACATFGTSFMREQLYWLKDFKRIFMLYDDEFFAQKKSQDAINNITNITMGQVFKINLNNIGDPDDLSQDDVRYVMNEFRRKIY